MKSNASDIAARLALHAESVCRKYLSNGRRSGRYWIVGDLANNKGSSLFVRLFGDTAGPRAAGKWQDASTGEYGDLLDIIQAIGGHHRLTDALDEARSFLADPETVPTRPKPARMSADRATAYLRLFRSARPIAGTTAEIYLRARSITGPLDYPALRFHPACYYRADDEQSLESWPALLAAASNLTGPITSPITGLQRTWLARDGRSKAPLEDPRRAMGVLQGHAVRLGQTGPVLMAGEGLETMLSLRDVVPALPAAAALSAPHLALLILPPGLIRLYIAADNDPAGAWARDTLAETAAAMGAETRFLVSRANDFNADLCNLGHRILRTDVLRQLDPADRCLAFQ